MLVSLKGGFMILEERKKLEKDAADRISKDSLKLNRFYGIASQGRSLLLYDWSKYYTVMDIVQLLCDYRRLVIKATSKEVDFLRQELQTSVLNFDSSYLHLEGNSVIVKEKLRELSYINERFESWNVEVRDKLTAQEVNFLRKMHLSCGLTPLPNHFFNGANDKDVKTLLLYDKQKKICGNSIVMKIGARQPQIALMMSACIVKPYEGRGLSLLLAYHSHHIAVNYAEQLWGIASRHNLHVIKQLNIFGMEQRQGVYWILVER